MKIRHFKFWVNLASTLFFLLISKISVAQIVPDTTLTINSRVTPQGNISPIEGGTQVGNNLFHSFQEFSIPTDHTAFFNNALDIQNIISRVTGNSASYIDGLIRANGTANLFLLNPNGIAFGPNAQLNIGGSFLASTANSMKFADGTQFNAKSEQTAPLLTVSVPVGLQFSSNSQPISVQQSNLQVLPGKSLALVGGELNLIGSNLTAERGRIYLASLISGEWSLVDRQIAIANQYADIRLSQQAVVDASGAGGGNIQVQGRQISLKDGSQIKANTLGGEAGGNLSVNATESVEVIGRLADGTPSALKARVESGATGTGGNVNIVTRRLRVEGGARVAASSLSETGANAGNISVHATDAVELIGVGSFLQGEQTVVQPSALSTQTYGLGNAGNLDIVTGRLIAEDGGQVSSETFGAGQAGDVRVSAESVELNRRSANGTVPSAIFARVREGGTGSAGNVFIQTGRLSVNGGAKVAASSLSETGASAGNISVQASDVVELIGVGNVLQGEQTVVQPSALSTQTYGVGNAGKLDITARRLIARDGGQVSSETFAGGDAGDVTVGASQIELNGRSPDGSVPSALLARVREGATGNAGNMAIDSDRVILTNGARVATASLGEGNAGNLSIQATDTVEVKGVGRNPNGDPNPTQISVLSTGSGKGGSLNIQTSRLIAENGGQVSASAGGIGDGGTLDVNADEVSLIGRSPDGRFPSGLLARVESGATGNAKDLRLQTRRLLLQDGARVAAASLGQGNAGNLTIQATDSVEITGFGTNPDGSPNPTQLSALSTGTGNAGTLTIETNRLTVGNAAQAIVSSSGTGNPGNLRVEAPIVQLDRGALQAESATGRGGNISLSRSRNVQLRNQSIISADSGPGGSEGDININTETIVLLEGSRIITDAEAPQGGSNIRIQAPNNSRLAVFTSSDSIIRARGEVTVEGEVEVQPPDLPQVEVIDATQLVAQACPAENQGNSFYVTGRGGLPPSPDDTLNGDLFWEDLRIGEQGRSRSISNSPLPKPNSHSQIIEAQGWTIGTKGEVILTAKASEVTPHQGRLIPSGCQKN